jgi:hypothetical protein
MHAHAIAWAFRTAGVDVFDWGASPYPAEARLSLEIGSLQNPLVSTSGQHLSGTYAAWFRRLPNVDVHPDAPSPDVSFCHRQSSLFLDQSKYAFSPTLWVNHPTFALQAESKPLQLSIAKKLGILIPSTLISNDPTRIRQFAREHNGGIVLKSIRPGTWGEDSGAHHTTHTAFFDEREFSDDVLALCPAIFQTYIKPDIELRVTIFNDYALCLRIEHDDYRIPDWRPSINYKRSKKTLSLCDNELKTISCKILDQLNLNFGIVEFIVSDGNLYFVEVNQAGSFFFLDQINDELDIFRNFCCYLSNSSDVGRFPTFRDYLDLYADIDWSPRVQNADGVYRRLAFEME